MPASSRIRVRHRRATSWRVSGEAPLSVGVSINVAVLYCWQHRSFDFAAKVPLSDDYVVRRT
nr:hypothetical protein XfCFBP8356_09455 [Xylella fastidiosa subsp. sandyi]